MPPPPRVALAVRAIHDDPVVSSDGGLLAQRARRRDACVETLVQQARTLLMRWHPWTCVLGVVLCASDSELAAAVVEHSVVGRWLKDGWVGGTTILHCTPVHLFFVLLLWIYF